MVILREGCCWPEQPEVFNFWVLDLGAVLWGSHGGALFNKPRLSAIIHDKETSTPIYKILFYIVLFYCGVL